MPEQNKKLTGFEALYQVDQKKRQQQQRVESVDEMPTPAKDDVPEDVGQAEATRSKLNGVASKSESKLVRNITSPKTIDTFEPTTFKADRKKVLALKRLALELDPARKLQDLFDEALADVLAKYGRRPE